LQSDTEAYAGYVGSEILAKKETNPSSNMEIIREFWGAAAEVTIPAKKRVIFKISLLSFSLGTVNQELSHSVEESLEDESP
jgi:hypothetical protein